MYKCKKRVGLGALKKSTKFFTSRIGPVITQVYEKFNKLSHRIFHLTNWAIITQIYENSINFYMNIDLQKIVPHSNYSSSYKTKRDH